MSTTIEPPPTTNPCQDRRDPAPSTSGVARLLRQFAKGAAVAVGLTLVAPAALTCSLERRLHSRDECFLFWGQGLALVPGLPGKFLRRCFYHYTLRSCALDVDVGFLSCFHDRRADVSERVYIGTGVGLGLVSLGSGVLVGSRVSFLSGGGQHAIARDGRLTPFDRSAAVRVRVGAETWIGEAAIVMADVGSRCIVGAGSVVSRPIPDNCVVAGVPARFVRKSIPEAEAEAEDEGAS